MSRDTSLMKHRVEIEEIEPRSPRRDRTEVTKKAEVKVRDRTEVTKKAEVRRGKCRDCVRWRPPAGGGPSGSWSELSP